MRSLRTSAAELRLAVEFLTILPLKTRLETSSQEAGEAAQIPSLGSSAGWFPWVGVVVGGVAATAWWLGGLVFPPLLGAVLAVAAWAAVTGGLHLDGLADCCDGLFSPAAAERRLEIMRDPRLGVFGATGLVLALALKIAALSSLNPSVAVLAMLLAACNGRGLILLASRQPAARPGGMGGNFLGELDRASLLLAAVPVVGLVILLGWVGLMAVLAALLTGLAIFALARHRIGGVTGDVLGFVVEAGELAALLAFNLKLPV